MDTSRYQNGSIYKLCCKDSTITDCYVGSTCAFRNRKYNHKTCCNNEKTKGYNFNVYKFIRENGGWENWQMIELLKYPCETKRELELKEREYLELLGGTLNKQTPTRSSKEYYEANKEELLEKANEKFNCDCGGRYSKACKTYHLKTPKHQKYLNEIKE